MFSHQDENKDRSLPKPDWTLNDATFQDESVTISWAEGMLPRNRPFYAEVWKTDPLAENTILTVTFSNQGLEGYSHTALLTLLTDAGLVRMMQDECYLDSGIVNDSFGNPMWSVNLVLKDSKTEYATLNMEMNSFVEE